MRKNYYIVLSLFLLLIAGVVTGCGKTSARTIKVEELEGSASVISSNETNDACEGQNLNSGDEVLVNSGSNMLLLLDKDKHVFASEGADFVIVADGAKKETKTIVEQSSGTMVFGIDNKLEEEESFEVSTPNATMAVRGTVFTVKIEGDDATVTELSVSEGCVTASTVENGEFKTMEINAGESAVFSGVNEPAPVDLEVPQSDDLSDDDTADTDDSEQYPGSLRISVEVRAVDDDYEEQIREIATTASSSGDEGIYNLSAYIILDEPVELTDGYVVTKIPCYGMIYENGYEQYLGKHIVVDCIIDHTDYSDKLDCTDELFGTDYTAQVVKIVSE